MDEMKSLIRYKTKPESADENQRLVEKVYEELAARDSGGIRYATLRLEDGVSFVHIFMTDSDDTPNGLGRHRRFRRVPARARSAMRRTPSRPGCHRRGLLPAPVRLIPTVLSALWRPIRSG